VVFFSPNEVADTKPCCGLDCVLTVEKLNPANEAVPPGVVMLILPVAPEPTTAVIAVADTTLNEAAGVPPKLTDVVPVKFVPDIVTVAPVPAVAGVKELIVGAGN
jgi:hypothetical protein